MRVLSDNQKTTIHMTLWHFCGLPNL